MVQLVKKWVKQRADLSSTSKPSKVPISDADPQRSLQVRMLWWASFCWM